MSNSNVWKKSSYSAGSGNDCVEVKVRSADQVAIRDSKDPHGPRLEFSASALGDFLSAVTAGEFGGKLAV